MRFSILSLSILVIAFGNVIAEHPSAKIRSSARQIDFASLPAAKEPASNAVRLAQGLPLKKPRIRRNQHGTPVDSAHRAKRSTPVPGQQTCKVLVKTADKTLGYLSSTFNEHGLFHPDPTEKDPLVIAYGYEIGNFLTYQMRSTNGPAAYPHVGVAIGLVANSTDIGTGNSNFGYLAGTQTSTGAFSPAIEGDNSLSAATGIPLKYESGFWLYDQATRGFSIQWINSSRAPIKTYLIYLEDLNGIGMTGDPNAVRSAFGSAYPDVTLTCVPV
ncbi:unnamed protein product [Rhizoctonia solani]|uniref:Uncharacterized protein n=1 Tax=Rhizoctonia solani TaxID=456999 RepID=A0A8H3AJD3_9AGAM|nr:unnamed protein product [Rhizoctonia solani]